MVVLGVKPYTRGAMAMQMQTCMGWWKYLAFCRIVLHAYMPYAAICESRLSQVQGT